jgi:HK97 family phage portal protein
MAVVQSVGELANLDTNVWSTVSYGSLRMYDQFNYDYATLYKTQPNVRTCVDFLARNIAQLGLHVFRRVSDTDRVRLTDHPLAKVIERPLPAEFKVTRYRLMESLMGDLGVYFNAYWLKVRVPDAPLGLLRIPPQLVTVYGDLVPDRYEMTLSGKLYTFATSEIVHFRGYNAEDAVSGLSPLETLRRVLAEEHAAGDYREHFWQNAARQAGIIERPAAAPEWSDPARTRFKQEFEALYSGGDNSGKTAILEEGMTWRAGTFNAQESEYLAGRKLTREECARAYHIPLPMVGILDNATFSNITEQHKNLYQDSLGPWLAMIEQEIELQLLPEFDDTQDVYVEFNIAEKLKGSFEEQIKALQSAVGRPWMTADEARSKMNLPSLGGDAEELVTPLNMMVGAPQPAAPKALEQEQRKDALMEFNAALADFRAAIAAAPTEAMPREMKLVVEGMPQAVVNVSAPVTVQPQPIQAIQAKLDVLPTPVTVQNNVSVEPTPVTVRNNITVEPTPVIVENNVPAQPVTLTMQGTTSVVKRDAEGRIVQIESEPGAG